MHIFDVLDVAGWAALVAELISALFAFLVWLKLKTKPSLLFMLYLVVEFFRGSMGIRMSELRISNHSFYFYSSLISQSFIFLLVLSILKERKHRVRTFWAYAIILVASIVPEFTQLEGHFRPHSQFPFLFHIFAGIMILNDRVINHDGKRFAKDPWSVIALVFVITESVSTVSIISGNSAGFMKLSNFYFGIAFLIVIMSVIIRHLLFTRQLWKLKNYS